MEISTRFHSDVCRCVRNVMEHFSTLDYAIHVVLNVSVVNLLSWSIHSISERIK